MNISVPKTLPEEVPARAIDWLDRHDPEKIGKPFFPCNNNAHPATTMAGYRGLYGARADFEIRYTFGLYPLQQYLIAFPDGRLQALGIAWDARPEDQGGQRWFHLYPDQNPHAGDRLHWTGIDQTWNFMRADVRPWRRRSVRKPASDSRHHADRHAGAGTWRRLAGLLLLLRGQVPANQSFQPTSG